MSSLAGKHVLILGLGESGLAMARWCARQGARLRVADSRAQPPGLDVLRAEVPGAEIIAGAFDVAVLNGIELVAVSPGLDTRAGVVPEARRRCIEVTGEMSLFAQALDEAGVRGQTRILAITGTNGKTTTTALTAALAASAGLDAVAAGNISPAALDVLMSRQDTRRPWPQCWVLELSSFQIETMHGLNPEAATVLNVTDDHLDRYADLADYGRTKARIFQGQGVQVLNADDDHVAAMQLPGRKAIRFGRGVPAAGDYGLIDKDGQTWLARGDEALIPMEALPLAGLHNAANALAALALCEAGLGLAPAGLLSALRIFHGLPHRVELIAERADGVRFYDDSKGTNVGATLAALEGLGRKVVLIAGGDGKGQDFSPLKPVLAQHARAVLLIGRDAAMIEKAIAGCGAVLEHATDLPAAVARANALAQPGDVVLLSPACASLDMFRNYAHRAQVFIDAARALPEVSAR